MRHGRTEANEGEPRIRAWKDYPLDESKKVEIKMTAQKLKSYSPGFICSSDLMRDTNTADIVAGVLNQSNRETDFNARTWDMGSFEGQYLKDVNPAIDGLYRRPWEVPLGSCESFNGFSKRWLDLLDRRMTMAAEIPQFRPGLIVTHGKNIALANSYIEGIPAWEARMPLPAGYAVISVNYDRTLSLEIKTESEPVIEDV